MCSAVFPQVRGSIQRKIHPMKFRLFFTLFLAVFSLAAFTQDEPKPEKPKFALGVNFSPGYAYRFIWLSKDASSFTHKVKELFDDTEEGKFGYTTGLNFSWFPAKRLTLETGIWFSNKGFDLKWVDLSTATGEPDPIGKAKVRYSIAYLSVPVKVNFNILTSPLTLFISAGITADYLLYSKSKIFVVYTDGHTDSHTSDSREGLKDLTMSALGSVGLEYTFLKHFRVRFEPTYMMNILKIGSGDAGTYLWSVGGNVGMYYVFY